MPIKTRKRTHGRFRGGQNSTNNSSTSRKSISTSLAKCNAEKQKLKDLLHETRNHYAMLQAQIRNLEIEAFNLKDPVWNLKKEEHYKQMLQKQIRTAKSIPQIRTTTKSTKSLPRWKG